MITLPRSQGSTYSVSSSSASSAGPAESSSCSGLFLRKTLMQFTSAQARASMQVLRV